MDPHDNVLLVSVDRAAELIDMSRSQVYVELACGRLDAVKDGRRCKVTMDSIRRRVAGLPRADIKLAPSVAARGLVTSREVA